ncbi:NAD(P)-dependent oxidoreductase [Streptomyces sp. 6-11-2]|uniref:NAD(P)-dependent oxidoreductase n=1 Tax=Streptomyces sp. 6-11-2 TaxID=2585753 RepID=UPI0011412D1E|nr:NAD(P)-dependent oxidoreductase [Streptomyces sp. 6-11-2]GED89441.1 dehydrogenase [Streptomyces sp. 6-11-2]
MDGIGFVGLGTMGRPMARRLLAAGHRVVVWNRSRPAVEELRGDGAEAATDLVEVFGLPVVMSMLSDDAGIRSLILDSGVLDGAECRVHVNLATVSAGFAAEAEQRHTQRGIGYVAAPVLGRADVAAAGKLNVLAAGAPEALDLARPVLEPLAGRIWELGDDPARANVVKIAVNFLLAAAIEATAEATSLVESYGVDAAAFVELISGTLFPGPVYGTYGGLMAEQRYEPPGFTTRLGLKDVGLALSAAHRRDMALPTGSLVRDALLEAVAAGWSERDWATLAEVARRRAGR